jgi:hypothetical protein
LHWANGWKNWTIETLFRVSSSNLVTAFMSHGAWPPVSWEPIVAPQYSG